MSKVSLALLWHHHQPYYPDLVSGSNPMPWVRLHSTKDYLGMALHLKEVPEFRCTVNLVPSLLVQIDACSSGLVDRHLLTSRKPVDGLDRDDVLYMLDHFFMASFDTMIKPHARYLELFQKRGQGSDSAEAALARFRERDLRDLQVWSNLAWVHPLAFELEPDLAEFQAKGRNYSETEKTWFLSRQLDLIKQVIPLYKRLANEGQIELSTTPFYHPILPLLLDKKLAREAMPGVNLPHARESLAADAQTQVARAVASHVEHFGSAPRGMWPSEGSVCQAMIPMLAGNGIRWIATDEEILNCSLHGKVSRDSRGHVKNPDMLYRPWLVREGGDELAIVFRDHALSDQIGFHYQRSPGEAAAADFMAKLHAIGDACRGRGQTLAPVILDGENCWEYYPDGGVSFLRSLYRSAARDGRVKPTTIGEYLREHPPVDAILRLFAGSWISHNFAIWIGHEEDNRAWDLLHSARAFLDEQTRSGRHGRQAIDQAWEELYIAEGSDWFWWYGDDHSSAQDALFDQLFRKHLRNIYTLLNQEAPGGLFAPISRSAGPRRIHGEPTSLLKVKVDGRYSYFEWINAAKHVCGSEPSGAATQVAAGLMRVVWFGFNLSELLIRVDAAGLQRWTASNRATD